MPVILSILEGTTSSFIPLSIISTVILSSTPVSALEMFVNAHQNKANGQSSGLVGLSGGGPALNFAGGWQGSAQHRDARGGPQAHSTFLSATGKLGGLEGTISGSAPLGGNHPKEVSAGGSMNLPISDRSQIQVGASTHTHASFSNNGSKIQYDKVYAEIGKNTVAGGRLSVGVEATIPRDGNNRKTETNGAILYRHVWG